MPSPRTALATLTPSPGEPSRPAPMPAGVTGRPDRLRGDPAAPADSERVTAVTAARVAAPRTAAVITERVLAGLTPAPCCGHCQMGGSLPRAHSPRPGGC